MTGLLRSLGAQALDHAPALRPAARLRGAAETYVDRDPEGETVTPSAPIVHASVARSSARTAPSAAAATSYEDPRPAPVRAAAEGARDDREAATRVRAHEGARLAVPRHDTVEPAERVVRAAVREAARARTNGDAPPGRRARAADTTGTNPTAKPTRSDEPRARFDEPRFAAARRAHEPPLPDVQIHIGRIELTAVTPPASSTPRAVSEAKKPMSLDDYLRERRRKTP